MQNVVIDKPYKFIAPKPGWFWPSFLVWYAPRHLRKGYGIVDVKVEHAERLQQSVNAGHGVLLAPNHCRDCDPVVLYALCNAVNRHFYLMASWHLFMNGKARAFLANRAGAFSIYREGMDRTAVNAAIEILEKAERPLVLFPEGVVSRTNDRLLALLDGTALIARSAAKKRAKLTPAGKVVIHPIGIRYSFHGDINQTVAPVLDEIEQRLSWRKRPDLSLTERVFRVGRGLIALKEVEYMGEPQTGDFRKRLERLLDAILEPLEKEWLEGQREPHVVARVKRLRAAILPDMISNTISEAERQRRWLHLADIYVAQQIAHYPPDYIASDPKPERLLETVERFEEDLTDTIRPHPPITAVVRVGEAIEVNPGREARGEGDPLMKKVEQGIRQMLGLPERTPDEAMEAVASASDTRDNDAVSH